MPGLYHHYFINLIHQFEVPIQQKSFGFVKFASLLFHTFHSIAKYASAFLWFCEYIFPFQGENVTHILYLKEKDFFVKAIPTLVSKALAVKVVPPIPSVPHLLHHSTWRALLHALSQSLRLGVCQKGSKCSKKFENF